MAKTLFFLGKGGVGKTTTSALTAYFCSENKTVEIYSLDQAHNLGDVFNIKLSDNLTKIKSNLWAAEIDIEKWKQNYLDNLKNSVKGSYSYLTAFNMLDYLELFKYAPDIDQLAITLAVSHIWTQSTSDIIIFDMPPTALSLQLLKSVESNIIWLDKLITLRQKIKEKRELITKIKVGKKQIETDKILNKLTDLLDFYKNFKSNLVKSKFFIVYNPDTLSQLEEKRIENELKALNYKNFHTILNKQDRCQRANCLEKFESSENLAFQTIIEKNQGFFEWISKNLS